MSVEAEFLVEAFSPAQEMNTCSYGLVSLLRRDYVIL